jgi:hypothetical protein
MASNIEQLIDEKIRARNEEIQQLAELKKMAKNPELAELMRQIGSAAADNGNGTPKPSVGTARKDVVVGPSDKRSRNGLTDAVTKAVAEFGTYRFIIHDVVRRVENSGFHFVAKNHRIAVSSVLEKLLARGIIKLAQKRVGNAPHVYEYLGERKA